MATVAAIPPTTAPAPRLPLWRKIAYGFGDVIIGIRQTAFQFYLMPFYTDVVGLAPSLRMCGRHRPNRAGSAADCIGDAGLDGASPSWASACPGPSTRRLAGPGQ